MKQDEVCMEGTELLRAKRISSSTMGTLTLTEAKEKEKKLTSNREKISVEHETRSERAGIWLQ